MITREKIHTHFGLDWDQQFNFVWSVQFANQVQFFISWIDKFCCSKDCIIFFWHLSGKFDAIQALVEHSQCVNDWLQFEQITN